MSARRKSAASWPRYVHSPYRDVSWALRLIWLCFTRTL
jgi:hypothetical protein